jgi:hypothetical protein
MEQAYCSGEPAVFSLWPPFRSSPRRPFADWLQLNSFPGLLSLPLDVLRLLFSEEYMEVCSLMSSRSTCKVLAGIIPPTGQFYQFCGDAAERGYLGLLQWAFSNSETATAGLPVCCAAARGGQLAVLKWARSKGFPWEQVTCYYAAEGGHLEVLKWARANGCPWDGQVCWEAARNGHLAVLKWARKNGCPWDANTCAAAAEGDHLHVLRWALANGCLGGQ